MGICYRYSQAHTIKHAESISARSVVGITVEPRGGGEATDTGAGGVQRTEIGRSVTGGGHGLRYRWL